MPEPSPIPPCLWSPPRFSTCAPTHTSRTQGRGMHPLRGEGLQVLAFSWTNSPLCDCAGSNPLSFHTDTQLPSTICLKAASPQVLQRCPGRKVPTCLLNLFQSLNSVPVTHLLIPEPVLEVCPTCCGSRISPLLSSSAVCQGLARLASASSQTLAEGLHPFAVFSVLLRPLATEP